MRAHLVKYSWPFPQFGRPNYPEPIHFRSCDLVCTRLIIWLPKHLICPSPVNIFWQTDTWMHGCGCMHKDDIVISQAIAWYVCFHQWCVWTLFLAATLRTRTRYLEQIAVWGHLDLISIVAARKYGRQRHY